MPVYIHELGNWPHFRWDHAAIAALLAKVSRSQGRLVGRMEALGFDLRNEAVLETLAEDVQKSSEIEGEILNKAQVRSSVARRLGIDIAALPQVDRKVEGIVEMTLNATQRFDAPLNEERLFAWHASLFPTGHSGMSKIKVGDWREDQGGPMQVVSGPIGREIVHYQAPSANLLKSEMSAFLKWFEENETDDLVFKAALAHLWFVTIHPFDDGNGRIARAIADMALARSENSSQRNYSMSAQIRKERNTYYDILERTQKGDLDITEWLTWFLECLGRSIEGAEGTLTGILEKAAFWEKFKNESISKRQRLVLNRLLDGFEGKLTSSKWAKLTKTSQDTAYRDVVDLVERGILKKDAAGGRSTSYSLIKIQDDA
ncbi:MAG: Fic family protein [Rhodobacteraceae bacterium]|nr:Fic family protein [Paracoccaceae bacterium]